MVVNKKIKIFREAVRKEKNQEFMTMARKDSMNTTKNIRKFSACSDIATISLGKFLLFL